MNLSSQTPKNENKYRDILLELRLQTRSHILLNSEEQSSYNLKKIVVS